jgi:hypothetical protein
MMTTRVVKKASMTMKRKEKMNSIVVKTILKSIWTIKMRRRKIES